MKKAFVFDFDDTLATTDCKVIVRRPNGHDARGLFDDTLATTDCKVIVRRPKGRGTRGLPIRKLTPAEFNTDVLNDGEEYDFSEFRSAEFIRTANPTFLMALAKEVHDEGHAVYVLTARADNVADAIADWLCGFDVKPVRVFGVGSDDKKVDIPSEKQKVLQTLNQLFDVVYFYDDDQHNVDLAGQVGVKTYLV